jgi:hypothetical protein
MAYKHCPYSEKRIGMTGKEIDEYAQAQHCVGERKEVSAMISPVSGTLKQYSGQLRDDMSKHNPFPMFQSSV